MKGTKELRRTIKGVGLIRVASGTHSAKVYDRMNERLTQLAEARRLDWLRAIRDKLMEPAEWFERTSVGDFSQLGSPAIAPFTVRKIEAWVADFEASERHRTDVRLTLLRLAKRTKDATNLPAVLKKLRASHKASGKAVAFNRMKAHVQTYLRDTVTINHPAYLAVRAIRNLPASPKRQPFPCTVVEAVTIARGLGPQLGAVWLTMCVTGAGPKELWVDGLSVDVATGHLRIAGQKRRSRNRLVPLVADLGQLVGRPAFPYRLLRETLSTLTEGRVEPYDARRTYAKWLALAGVPLPHQDAYLGHGPRTMTGLYQDGNEGPYLTGDAQRVADFIRKELAESAGKDAGLAEQEAEPVAAVSGGATADAPGRNRTFNLLIKSPTRYLSRSAIEAQQPPTTTPISAADAQGSATAMPEFMPEVPRATDDAE